MTALWLLVGAFIGFDVAITYAWLTARRANRSVTRRIAPYTTTLRFDTPTARQALRRLDPSERAAAIRDWTRPW